jgi:serine/threonine protein kinase
MPRKGVRQLYIKTIIIFTIAVRHACTCMQNPALSCEWSFMPPLGVAAKLVNAGTERKLSFSPLYAAPEIFEALEAGAKTVTADGATDIWALGVMALELLAKTSAFPADCGWDDLKAMLLGKAPMPWEEGGAKRGAMKELRGLQKTVEKCLERNPRDRPTATELFSAWTRMFDRGSTQTA